MLTVTFVGRSRRVRWGPILTTLSPLIFAASGEAAPQSRLPHPGGESRPPAFNNPPRVAVQTFRSQPPASFNRLNSFQGVQPSPRQNFQPDFARPMPAPVSFPNPIAYQARPYVFNNPAPFRPTTAPVSLPNPATYQTRPYVFNGSALPSPTTATTVGPSIAFRPSTYAHPTPPPRTTFDARPFVSPHGVDGIGKGLPNRANTYEPSRIFPDHRPSTSIVIGTTSNFASLTHSQASNPTRTGPTHPPEYPGPHEPYHGPSIQLHPPTVIGPRINSGIDQEMARVRRESLRKLKGIDQANGNSLRPVGTSPAAVQDLNVHGGYIHVGLPDRPFASPGLYNTTKSKGLKATPWHPTVSKSTVTHAIYPPAHSTTPAHASHAGPPPTAAS